MIRFVDLSKTFYISGKPKVIIKPCDLTIPTGASVALIGRNGAGKSSLLRMIAGTMRPTTGRIETTGTLSWPVGFRGGFSDQMTGAQNARFIARIYGVDSEELVEFVREFAELGEHFYEPVRTYSSGMRARFGFSMSMGIRFDTYLIDEVTAVGDVSFRAKSQLMLQSRLEESGVIMVNHSLRVLRRICTSALLLEAGHFTLFEDIEEALAVHNEMLSVD